MTLSAYLCHENLLDFALIIFLFVIFCLTKCAQIRGAKKIDLKAHRIQDTTEKLDETWLPVPYFYEFLGCSVFNLDRNLKCTRSKLEKVWGRLDLSETNFKYSWLPEWCPVMVVEETGDYFGLIYLIFFTILVHYFLCRRFISENQISWITTSW